jgi:beta-xylosidase
MTVNIKVKRAFASFFLIGTIFLSHAQNNKATSGNPLFPGWYADPEGVIFNKTYWIYPTYSAKYGQQVFLDAFSSPDLITWKKHNRIVDTSAIKWAKRAMWAPAIVEKKGKYFLFFGANDIQSNDEYGGIGVAVADNPRALSKIISENHWLINFTMEHSQSINLFLRIKTDNTI